MDDYIDEFSKWRYIRYWLVNWHQLIVKVWIFNSVMECNYFSCFVDWNILNAQNKLILVHKSISYVASLGYIRYWLVNWHQLIVKVWNFNSVMECNYFSRFVDWNILNAQNKLILVHKSISYVASLGEFILCRYNILRWNALTINIENLSHLIRCPYVFDTQGHMTLSYPFAIVNCLSFLIDYLC